MTRRSFSRICVYCGSSQRVDPRYLELATEVGRQLAGRGHGVVYGGGHIGLMGRVADGALAAGGEVIGVIPEKLRDLELAHAGCTEMHVVDTMHARKTKMASLADAFIALPGGWGTLEEIFEVTTWTQLEYHRKPVGLLNAFGYYDHLLAFVAHATQERFIRVEHRPILQFSDELDALLEQLAMVELPQLRAESLTGDLSDT